MTIRLRPIAEPFVVARPGGARIRTRLAVGPDDEEVLLALGAHLGSVMGRDLAQRCREGGGVGPEGPTGIFRATRWLRTVRGRPPGRTHYCSVF